MDGLIQNPAVKKIWRTTMVVRGIDGAKIGCGIFIFAVFFKDKFLTMLTPAQAMTAIAALFSLFTILTTVLEVPTGAIGDIVGRKWSVVLSYASSFFYYLFMLLILLCDSLAPLIVISFFAIAFDALNATFYSGSFTAWCVDALRRAAPDVGYEQILAPAKKAYLLSLLLSGALSIWLYLHGYVVLVFLLGTIINVIAAFYCAKAMEEAKAFTRQDFKALSFAKGMQRMGEVIGVGVQLFRSSKTIVFLILIYAAYMSILHLTDYLWPVYLRSSVPLEQQQVYWIGLVIGLQLSSFFGAQGLTSWTKRWRDKGVVKAQSEPCIESSRCHHRDPHRRHQWRKNADRLGHTSGHPAYCDPGWELFFKEGR